jgi:hypothetical protein
VSEEPHFKASIERAADRAPAVRAVIDTLTRRAQVKGEKGAVDGELAVKILGDAVATVMYLHGGGTLAGAQTALDDFEQWVKGALFRVHRHGGVVR